MTERELLGCTSTRMGVTLFVGGLPESALIMGFRRTLQAAFKPYECARVVKSSLVA